MAVAAAQEHQRPERAGVDQLAGLEERTVVAVVVADPHLGAGCARGLGDAAQLRGVQRARFFHEGMLARAHGGEGQGSQRGVEGGNDHRRHARVGQHGRGVGDRGTPRDAFGEGGGARGIEVAGVQERRARAEGGHPLLPDEPAADDGKLGLIGFWVVHSVGADDEGEAKGGGDASDVFPAGGRGFRRSVRGGEPRMDPDGY